MNRQLMMTLGACVSLASASALALDPACTPIIASSEAKIAAPAWHATSQLDDFKAEVIKVGGNFFMKNDDQWMTSPVNMDDAERKTVESLKAGKILVTGCTDAGEETVEGMRTRALVYTVEVPGSGIPAAQTRLNVGIADGLPYRLSSAAGETRQQVTYRYTGVKAPL
jgi:hypothetical protein